MTSFPSPRPPRAKSGTRPGQPGELLTDHLRNTLLALEQIRARVGTIPAMPAGFWTWAALAALLHDTGKISDGFQRMVGNTAETARTWGERHEVLSLGFVEHLLTPLPAEDRLWIAAAVAGHHRPYAGRQSVRSLLAQLGQDTADDFFARFTPADPGHLTGMLRWLHTTAQQHRLPVRPDLPTIDIRDLTDAAFEAFTSLMERWECPQPGSSAILDGRTATLLLGAVTMADHLSSAHSPLDTSHPLTAGYPVALAHRLAGGAHTLRPQQGCAAQTSGHLLLRSWTGSGKTEAALLWAVHQNAELTAQLHCLPRLFYVLPYLASINAMVDRLETELDAPGHIGVAHSKAASYHLASSLDEGCATDEDPAPGTPVDPDAAAAKAHSRAQATRNFRELLRVGTPYQLLRGAVAGPIHAGILTDSANSVFVLDELHAYDIQRLGMILAMMRFWHETGGRIAVMSATLPRALADLVTTTLDNQVTLVEPQPGTPVPIRHRLHLRDDHLTSEPALTEIRAELAAGRSVLAVANNVRDAVTLYESLAPYCLDLHGEGSAHLLHSRYRRMDRDTIETALLARFAADGPRLPGLLVGTQALEVSLNLDLDICHTSAADLEALLQRFGRVNRLAAREPAPVIVHTPAYGPRRGTGTQEWADGVYEAEPVRHGWDILTRHDGQTINEQQVTAWLDEVYASDWGTQWRTETLAARDRFHEAFLTFAQPFEDRADLAERFDSQFEGTEAVLHSDLDTYEALLTTAASRTSGRLQADRYLIPLPYWAASAARYDKRLRTRVIDADYDPRLGLLAIYHDPRQTYQPGEVL